MKTKLLSIILLCSVSAFAQFGEQQIISTATVKPYLSIPLDIDNDGFIDILTASGETFKMSWYKNLDGQGNFGPEIIINETPLYYLSVEFVDIDGDGDKDILYLSNNPSYIAWLENLDGAGNFGPEQIINEQDFIHSVKSIDIDNDGDLDLMAAVTDTFTGWLMWFENTDGQGTFGPGNLLMENDFEYSKIALEDIDNDGLLDILATDFVYSQGKVFWYKNMGDGTFGAMQIIYQFNWISGGTNITDIRYVDINTDGKMDIVLTSEDINLSISINWIENLDNQGNFGDLQFISNINNAYLFYDLDNDNDNDILLWNPTNNLLFWRENTDGQGAFGTSKTISTQVDFPLDAKAADLDGDGWFDVISASSFDNKLAWYKNNTLGISENEISQYVVYPNPTNGIINVQSNLPISKISVFNILGQKIEIAPNTNQINLSKAEAGIYILKIENETGNSQTHKIVKK
jgi:hypothetical protein